MKVTILGSGSAYGVPFVGGNWGKCNPNNPKNRRTTPSILIENQDTKILVDMGPDFNTQSIKHQITLIDAVLFTHGHADHILGNFYIPKLMHYYDDRNLPLYATTFTKNEIEKMFWFQHQAQSDVRFSGKGRPEWHEMTPFDTIKIGSLSIQTVTQYHGSMESLGFRIGNFAYSTDFKDMPEQSFQMLQNLDVWLLECNCEIESDKHLHLERALELIARVKPKQAYLTHLDFTMDYDAISAKLPKNVALAYDGLELLI